MGASRSRNDHRLLGDIQARRTWNQMVQRRIQTIRTRLCSGKEGGENDIRRLGRFVTAPLSLARKETIVCGYSQS